MAGDMLSIAASGARAARAALDLTAHNIANSASEGYVRRSARIEEIASPGGTPALLGSRLAGVRRHADALLQAEARRTTASLAQADIELAGLRQVEGALEDAGLHAGLASFQASLQELAGNPIDHALRRAVLGEAEIVASQFNATATALEAAAGGIVSDAEVRVEEANTLAGELARINLRLARAGSLAGDRSSLLDQRDSLLEGLARLTDLTASLADDGSVSVALGSAPPRVLVAGGTAGTLTLAPGALAFAIDGQGVILGGGQLGGAVLAAEEVRAVQARHEDLAERFATTVNAAQTGGSALDGSPGGPLFGGSSAATLTVILSRPEELATASSGAAAGSRDTGTLQALRSALRTLDPAGVMSDLMSDVSVRVAARGVTRTAIETIAQSSRIALDQQAGVNLDTEAANLIRFQQAFQASGRAMQTASDIINTLLGIGR